MTQCSHVYNWNPSSTNIFLTRAVFSDLFSVLRCCTVKDSGERLHWFYNPITGDSLWLVKHQSKLWIFSSQLNTFYSHLCVFTHSSVYFLEIAFFCSNTSKDLDFPQFTHELFFPCVFTSPFSHSEPEKDTQRSNPRPQWTGDPQEML